MQNKKHILVTGAHRSGSTWIGHILSLSKEVRYIHEPFNLDINSNSPFKHWYEYISNDSEKIKQEQALKYLQHQFKVTPKELAKNLYKSRSTGEIKTYFKKYLKNEHHTLLMKDPLALMSAEWLYQQFGAKVVITVRHPAAFVASLKVKNWQFNFYNWLNQNDLMEAYLSPFRDQIKAFAESPPDIIEQGILLWNAIYNTVHTLRKKYPDWIIVKHEKISLEPVAEFEQLFKQLDLEFTPFITQNIIESTSGGNDKLKRDAKSNIKTWKQRLTEKEIFSVYYKTEDVAKYFYKEDDWE